MGPTSARRELETTKKSISLPRPWVQVGSPLGFPMACAAKPSNQPESERSEGVVLASKANTKGIFPPLVAALSSAKNAIVYGEEGSVPSRR